MIFLVHVMHQVVCSRIHRCSFKINVKLAFTYECYNLLTIYDDDVTSEQSYVTVVRCCQRSAAYSINLGADGSIEPIANNPEPALSRFPDQELPILRRGPRSSASSIQNSVAARGSGQVRLSMMSNSSSQHGPSHQRLAAISSAADSDVHGLQQQQVAIEPRTDGFVNAAEQVDVERVDQAELLGATGLASHFNVSSAPMMKGSRMAWVIIGPL